MMSNLLTKWGRALEHDKVLPDYPRPQMVREKWLNLNGPWDYTIRPADAQTMGDPDGHILVPFPVESKLSGVQQALLPHQRLWYRRSFMVPESWKEDRMLLHFGAVDWEAKVWVNGREAGTHTGGYYPFTFDITELLRQGENELIVAVWDPTDEGTQERGKQTLKPKGIFYTAVSGIWQTVWLEPVPRRYIQSHRMTPNLDQERLTVEITVGGQRNETQAEGATDVSPDREDSPYGELLLEATVMAHGKIVSTAIGSASSPLTIEVLKPRKWSPDSPFLYDLHLILKDREGRTLDQVTSYFGMRKFSIERDRRGKKRLFLNNEPLFHNGVLDQGYWPDGLYTAPSDEALRYDIEAAKKLGYNMIRKHIKVEPARWYYHCDRLGILVWQDMINGGGRWNHLHHLIFPNLVIGGVRVKDTPCKALGREDQASRDNYRKELKEMIDALYNVTSIAMWVPFNEAWGQFDAAEAAAWVQDYDPTRSVDHASGWHDQGYGDIHSLHIYFRKLALPSARRTKHRAIVISEYGGYSLHEPGHVWREDKQFGYRTMKSREQLAAAYAALIRDQLKPLISQGVAAAVYTQLTDVETETNGILSYDREIIKIDPEYMQNVHKEL